MYNHEISYSSGIIGELQRLAVQALPGISYLMPKKIDPYTGKVMTKYKLPFLVEFINSLSPIKIEDLQVSENEKIAIELGIKKGELPGRYDDIGTFNGSQREMLNKKYGELNDKYITEFVNNRAKYKVQMEDGSYKNLRYSQMTDTQKKSVIERIMSDNAKIAKIYVYTESGGKYYASDSMYKELFKLGIRKNVYKETNKLKGFA